MKDERKDLRDRTKAFAPPKNAWLGVRMEDQNSGVPRLDWLRQVSAHIRFVSVEPLLEDLGKLNLTGIHWVICRARLPGLAGERTLFANWQSWQT
jgi:protein gp37